MVGKQLLGGTTVDYRIMSWGTLGSLEERGEEGEVGG